MSPVVLVALALVAVFVLIMLHVPIGISMVVVGVLAFASMSNWTAALSLLSAEPASMMMSLDIGVIPLFLMMGAFATAGGLSDDIYRLAHALLGHRRGGLGVATVLGCGLFGSIAGSSVATTATFGQLALPQMRKRGYDAGFASGTIACGGTLGAMVSAFGDPGDLRHHRRTVHPRPVRRGGHTGAAGDRRLHLYDLAGHAPAARTGPHRAARQLGRGPRRALAMPRRAGPVPVCLGRHLRRRVPGQRGRGAGRAALQWYSRRCAAG